MGHHYCTYTVLSNTTSCENLEKIRSWGSFSFLSEYGAQLRSTWNSCRSAIIIHRKSWSIPKESKLGLPWHQLRSNLGLSWVLYNSQTKTPDWVMGTTSQDITKLGWNWDLWNSQLGPQVTPNSGLSLGFSCPIYNPRWSKVSTLYWG